MPIRRECRLRTIQEADLDKLLEWRNSDNVRTYMYTDHIISMEEHRAWYTNLKAVHNSQCMIFEILGKPVGVVSITHIDLRNNHCHWGFYVGESQTSHGMGSAMGYFALEYIFESLNIHKLIGEVLATNMSSIRYHKKFGFVQEAYFSQHVLKRNTYEDVISFGLLRDDWMKLKNHLQQDCFDGGISHE
jgi:UDP-4-amino-4,6-dideoxy-N-acetyl-beta-L-altrosamine N-acetyltransferase